MSANVHSNTQPTITLSNLSTIKKKNGIVIATNAFFMTRLFKRNKRKKVFKSTLPLKLTYNLTSDVNPMKISLITDSKRASTVFGYTVEEGYFLILAITVTVMVSLPAYE